MRIGNSLLVLFLMLAAVTGCQHDPYAGWFVEKDVPEAILIGTYHVTAETIKHFSGQDIRRIPGGRLPINKDARTVLEKDHRMSLTNIPIDLGDRELCILNGEGTWRVRKYQRTSVYLTLASRGSVRACPEGEFAFELFDDSASPFHSQAKYPLLHLTIGDPDSGDALQFEKD